MFVTQEIVWEVSEAGMDVEVWLWKLGTMEQFVWLAKRRHCMHRTVVWHEYGPLMGFVGRGPGPLLSCIICSERKGLLWVAGCL
jgi:hypothetical protein